MSYAQFKTPFFGTPLTSPPEHIIVLKISYRDLVGMFGTADHIEASKFLLSLF